MGSLGPILQIAEDVSNTIHLLLIRVLAQKRLKRHVFLRLQDVVQEHQQLMRERFGFYSGAEERHAIIADDWCRVLETFRPSSRSDPRSTT